MRTSGVLLLFAAMLALGGAAWGDDYGNPYRYYRAPGMHGGDRAYSYGNPYRYYRTPSFYDTQRPSGEADINELRRETLQYLYRHQLIPDPRVDRYRYGRPRELYYPHRRPYFYSSPYIYGARR